MDFQVGYAQTVITPLLDRPVYLAGFGRNRQAQSVHDDLYVRALALMANGRLILVLALDLISLHRGQCQAIEQGMQARLPGAQALIACTHTHHGPDTLGLWGPDDQTSGVDAYYMERVLAAAVETAVYAAAATQPARLARTAVHVHGVAKNARDPQILDEELTCLQFRAVDGERPLATWLIFACHPEVLWDQNPHITSDYMYTLRRTVETETGAPCVGHVGALGGMMTPDVVARSFAEAEEMGWTLAQAALQQLANTPAADVAQISYARREYSLPMENPLFRMAAAAGLLPNVEREDGTILTEASLLRLDDAWIFAVPGELLPKLGLEYRRMMEAAGARVTAVLGLANDELGYILPAEDFTAPGNYLAPGDSYEESMSVTAQAGPALTAALASILDNLKK